MKRLHAGAFLAALLLALPYVANAQVENEVRETEAVGVSYSRAETSQYQGSQRQDYYNPWTIHRKVAQYGLAGSMGATMLGALAMRDEYFNSTIIPVVGPYITIAQIENDPAAYYKPGGKTLLIASAVGQSAFLIYLTVAWIGESTHDARRKSGLSVEPARTGRGVSLTYRF